MKLPSPLSTVLKGLPPEMLVAIARFDELKTDDWKEIAPASLDLPPTATEKRIKERLSALYLLRSLPGMENCHIGHAEDGAPVIEGCGTNSSYISVTHSRNYCVVAVAPFQIGIDIEEPSEKLRRVATKFLTHRELKRFMSIESLLRAWTIKEAVYKLFHNRHPALTDIEIHRLYRLKGIVSCRLHGDSIVNATTLSYPIDDAMLTIALQS